ncbi:MAG: class I SAM-dependent methyltransferase [Bacteroidia bacterium]
MSSGRKISKLMRALAAVAKKPALLNAVLDEEDEHAAAFRAESGMHNGFPELNLRDILPQSIDVEPFAFLDGGSLPTDLALIKALALKINAGKYFEIGTWRGESVANAASVVSECYTLNLSDEELKRRGLPEKYIGLHRHFSDGNPRITHLFGDSRAFDFSAFEGKMDLVFVDGDHHFDSVVNDTKTAFRLIRDGGAIIWHDYSHSPEQTRFNVAHAIWLGCPADKRKYLRAVSNTLCAVYIPFELPFSEREYPRDPQGGFKISISKTS